MKSEYGPRVSYEIQSLNQGVWEPRWNQFHLWAVRDLLRRAKKSYPCYKFRIVEVTRKVIAAKAKQKKQKPPPF